MRTEEEFITPKEAAELKGVTPVAIYTAVREGRLPHSRMLGHIALRKTDVEDWTPIRYRGRAGRVGRRPKGVPMSPEAKTRLSEAQKRRWAKRKQQ